MTRPKKVFSLREFMDGEQKETDSVLLNAEAYDYHEIRLPKEIQRHFGEEKRKTIPLYRKPGDSNSLVFDLHGMLERHGVQLSQEIGLFFYTLAMNEYPSQFRFRVDSPALRVPRQGLGPLIPAGGAIWRESMGTLPAVPAKTYLEFRAMNPKSNAYICDVGIFYAPGLPFWDVERF